MKTVCFVNEWSSQRIALKCIFEKKTMNHMSVSTVMNAMLSFILKIVRIVEIVHFVLRV